MSDETGAFADKGLQIDFKYADVPIFTMESKQTRAEFESISHWHSALELFYVYSGTLEIIVNGESVLVEAGHGAFLNSRRVHYSCVDSGDCRILLAILDIPGINWQYSAITEYFEKKFGWSTADYLILHPEVPWEQEVMDGLHKLHKELHEEDMNPFKVMAAAGYITALIGDNIPEIESESSDFSGRAILLNMTAFISEHYNEHITLDDIAAAGGICRSKCCQIFHDQIRQTPNNYLINYRIAKSCEFLRNTDMSIGEISEKSGFRSPSYFTNVFQKHIGATPREYRARNK